MDDKNVKYVLWFEELRKDDTSLVGGKCANLGELTSIGIPVPPGFAVTAEAYKIFLKRTGLMKKIESLLKEKSSKNPGFYKNVSEEIRRLIEEAEMPRDIEEAIRKAYRELCKRVGVENVSVAVRSSATAEDLPGASFAGQQETYLNIAGEDEVVKKVKKCWGSLFTPRAIFYREQKGFEHSKVLISVGVQKMVNAKAAGVMFTLNPTTGDESKIIIEGNWGLGETVVSGSVTPDRFVVDKETMKILERRIADKKIKHIRDERTGKTISVEIPKELRRKPCLTDEEVIKLAEYGKMIEEHYGIPQDIEWAIDGELQFPKNIFIVQARPETIWSVKTETEKARAPIGVQGAVVVRGLPASPGVYAGKAKVVLNVEEAASVIRKGDILVTKMTNPDWVPYMRVAGAIVTDEGGVTCHAAIVSRELGIPCIVGAGNATSVLRSGVEYTVDANSGVVYEGIVESVLKLNNDVKTQLTTYEAAPITGTKIFMNLGVPDKIEEYKNLPFDGIGLMRVEFIIASYIGEHPNYLIKVGREQEFVDKMAEGIAKVARAIYPRPVVVRFSDLKTNEYAKLKGGEEFEPEEDNPMLGWRGVSRYVSPQFVEAFRLEDRAIRKVREE